MVRLRSVILSATAPLLLFAVSLLDFHHDDAPPVQTQAGSEKTVARIPSVQNHSVPVTIYRPLAATADHPVPVILHSHGWAGSRENRTGAFSDYVNAGFGVVSIDMRGHGEAKATSEARVDHIDFEIQDVRAVINFLSAQPWVKLDRPGDPRLGAIGGSYGGAYQLLTAAIDGRLDAIVPEITWNDLPQALVPNGAPKSAWVDLLYSSGNAKARLHPTIHEAFVSLQTLNRLPDGSVPGTTDIQKQFTQSSAKSYPGRIDIPTLLVQGMPDTLFNLNEAAANYELVKATRAPVALVTHLKGHILSTQGTIPVPAPVPVGLQPPAGPTPCGNYDDLAIAWFENYLLTGRSPRVPDVCIALDDGTAITGNSFPLPGTSMRAFDFAAGSLMAQGAAGPNITLSVFTASEPTIVAGIPRLAGTAQSGAPDAIVYWKLVVHDGRTGAERIADSQVSPLRLSADPLATQSWSIAMGGVGVRLNAGDTLKLVGSNLDNQFAHNSEREPGAVVFGALQLQIPIVRDNGR